MFPIFRDLDEDPFFNGHRNNQDNNGHREHTRAFNSMFGRQGLMQPSLSDGRQRVRGQGQEMQPFGGMGMGMHMHMGGMLGMFDRMQQQMQSMHNDPNSHGFTQSSVYTYSNTGNGAPQVYEAHTSTKNAPGGVKETKRAVRDTKAGIEKMAVGHHIGDRSHVIEKQRNTRTGHVDDEENLYNLEEADKGRFNDEWKSRARFQASGRPRDRGVGYSGGADQLALPSNQRRVDKRTKRNRDQRTTNY